MEIVNLLILIGILIIIIALIYVYINKNGFRQTAINLIVEAENQFKKGENKEKIDYCIEKFISFIPKPFSLFITKEFVKNFIQKIFDEIKIALDNKVIKSK